MGVNLADAGDEAAAEVFADAVNVGREAGGEGGDFELATVLVVAGPLAGEFEGFAALHAGKEADDGGALGVFAVGFELGDGVVIFLVEENDALEDAGEGGGAHGRRESRGG